ncbi:MAG: DUF3596 domain-containing protein [Marinicella sp.]
MGHIRVRKETGKLYFDFTYQNLRCREQTDLLDTPINRKKLEAMLARITAEITLGQFDYATYFPNSKRLDKLKAIEIKRSKHIRGIPCFGEFVESWYDEMESSWRRTYQITISSIIRIHLKPHFQNELLDSISKAEILQFRAKLSKIKKPCGNPMSNGHINRIIKIMGMIMNEAADRFGFSTPYQNLKPLKTRKPSIEPFSLTEVYQIINNVRDDFKNYYTVRFFTGMRTGEINGLQWRYVDLENRLIMVRETWVKNRIEYTKTDSSQRDIQMSEPVYEALKNQQEVTGKQKFVFCTNQGTPLEYHNVSTRVWYPLLNYLGLNKRRPYQTRHTAATLWLASGENPEWVARQMGHANTEMLFRVYSRYIPNLTRKDGSAFEKLLIKPVVHLGDFDF